MTASAAWRTKITGGLMSYRRPRAAWRNTSARRPPRSARPTAIPSGFFGRHLVSASPEADAVDLCVAQIHSVNTGGDFLTVSRVFQIDNEVAEQNALVTADAGKQG